MGIRDPLSKAILFILQNLFDLQLIFLSCFSMGIQQRSLACQEFFGLCLGRANLNQPSLGSALGSVKSPWQPMVICSFRQVSIFFKTFLPWKPFRNEFAKPCPWTTIATPGSLDLHAETHYFSCSFPSTLLISDQTLKHAPLCDTSCCQMLVTGSWFLQILHGLGLSNLQPVVATWFTSCLGWQARSQGAGHLHMWPPDESRTSVEKRGCH